MGQEHSSPCELRQHPQSRGSGPGPAHPHSGTGGSHRSGRTSDKSSTSGCGTGASKYSRASGESQCSRHPDPGSGLKRPRGSLSSGFQSGVSRTNSNASSDSRNPRLPIYTNVHYRDVNNNDIYKPLKIGKNKIHRLKILDADKDTAIYLEKHLSIKSYLEKEGEKKIKEGPQLPEPLLKKSGIRNYTPKILCEKTIQKDLEHWI